jgi:multicomponent Na+:H+ antiporter subunit E
MIDRLEAPRIRARRRPSAHGTVCHTSAGSRSREPDDTGARANGRTRSNTGCREAPGRVLRATITLFVALAILWLMLSGPYSNPLSQDFHGLVAFLGVVACAAVVAIQGRMNRYHDDPTSYRALWRVPFYLPWLMWQIVLSAVAIARVILSPRLPIQPQMIRVPAPPLSDFGLAVYANSITLTPGTLTLDVRSGHILVHALTDATARDLETGEMARRVLQLEARSGAH